MREGKSLETSETETYQESRRVQQLHGLDSQHQELQFRRHLLKKLSALDP